LAKSESSEGAASDQASNERELLAAAGRRDRKAFAALYREFQPRLFAYLRRLLANQALVEEVTDDVMYVVWSDAAKFRGESSVSSWIFGIAYRKAITALRREGRHNVPQVTGPWLATNDAERNANLELINAGLAELSADHRQVIELTYFCGYSYQEIAEIADCPVNTVKTRMYHARRRLKVLLPRLAGEQTEMNRDQA
jgi:RNA polymerase sigma-70 factor (ECF subfamily)